MKNKKKAILCALLLTASNLVGCNSIKNEKELTIKEIEETAKEESIYSNEANRLYNEVSSKISSVRTFKNLKWDESLALKLVELLNERFPTSITYMNSNDAENAIESCIEALTTITAINLNNNTNPEDMINLADYVDNYKDKTFINDSFSIAKTAVINLNTGSYKNEVEWAKDKVNSYDVINLMNYEFEVTNKADFLQMNPGSRLLIQTIFNEANKYIPEEIYVKRDSSEETVREYNLYWKYFTNDLEKKVYLPRRTSDNKIIYVYTDQYCVDREVYTKEEMYALAGISSFEEQKKVGMEAKLWIWQMGIQTEIDNRIDDAISEIYAMNDAAISSDKVLKKSTNN